MEQPVTFQFGKRSLDNLATVHPDMQCLAKAALAASKVDFTVVEGKRTEQRQRELYGKGRDVTRLINAGYSVAEAERYAKPSESKVTNTLKSNHMSGKAIDVYPYIKGAVVVNPPQSAWDEIARAFRAAGAATGVKYEWGGDWKSFIDRPHFELK